MTTYAAGLRVGEVVRLKLTDIESGRLLLRIEQGKGRKGRYVMLSPRSSLVARRDADEPERSQRRPILHVLRPISCVPAADVLNVIRLSSRPSSLNRSGLRRPPHGNVDDAG